MKIKIKCLNCGSLKEKTIYKHRGVPKFCSPVCGSKYRSKNKRINVNCSYCGKSKSILKSTKEKFINRNYYCNRKCKESDQSGKNHPNWTGGLGSYRYRAINKYGLKCKTGPQCPLKNIKLPDYMCEVDHKDGNRNNNNIENLQILCIYCHRKKTIEGK